MKLKFRFYRTLLYDAIYKENLDIVKLLLGNKKINPNILNIYIFSYLQNPKFILYMKLIIHVFNAIYNYLINYI